MQSSSRHAILSSCLMAGLTLFLFSVPASATFGGKNGRITFVADLTASFQLYTINPDGSDLFQVTNLPPTSNSTWFPDYSPDGKQIVFCHDMTGSLELYVINADGTGLQHTRQKDEEVHHRNSDRKDFHFLNLFIVGQKDHGWVSAKQAFFMKLLDARAKSEWDEFMDKRWCPSCSAFILKPPIRPRKNREEIFNQTDCVPIEV